MTPWESVAGSDGGRLLLIADHASNRVPDDVALGVPPAVMREHVAVDIGVAPLARALCAMLGCAGVLAAYSRLVVDLNREEGDAALIPETSDGRAIPGNRIDTAGRDLRIDRYWRPYHDHIAQLISMSPPKMLVSLHSFTPRLRSGGADRPWQIGILYNRDARAARLALPLLATVGIVTGDNAPYSGTILNATMNRHGEGNGIPYLGIEVRQDLIGDEAGVAAWAGRLAPIVRTVGAAL